MKSRRTGTNWVGWIALRPAANQGISEDALRQSGWRVAQALRRAEEATPSTQAGATVVRLEALRRKTGSDPG